MFKFLIHGIRKPIVIPVGISFCSLHACIIKFQVSLCKWIPRSNYYFKIYTTQIYPRV